MGLSPRVLRLAACLGLAAAPALAKCPSGMADVDGKFCIDKYEATTVDRDSDLPLSPFLTPNPKKEWPGVGWQWTHWSQKPSSKGYEMPELPDAEKNLNFEPKAVSRKGVFPQGFMNRATADRACLNAGKRLCMREEWYKACVGPNGAGASQGSFPSAFPYGNKYEQGKCNIGLVNAHALVLVGRTSSELDDPRLMLAESDGTRLLKRTGEMSDCVNGYGVYDMVGNQDEVVADRNGDNMTFVGSFYSRTNHASLGCAAVINGHEATKYFDYSIGFRCCADPTP